MRDFTWNTVQEQSDDILSCGLHKLINCSPSIFSNVTDNSFGNYLILHDGDLSYIGEAKDITKRIRQQFKESTSTFYKNYNSKIVKIEDFRVQFISTYIGRKEIEEFGIVNIPTNLNKFQLRKRHRYEISIKDDIWNMVQNINSDLIKEGEDNLIKSTFLPWFDVEPSSTAGLYIVRDITNKIIYIGESSDLGERIKTHSERTYFSALRRHIGTNILDYKLQEIKNKKRFFSDYEDKKITEFLKMCKLTVFPVAFGRYELEEHLIKKYNPLLNKKGRDCSRP